MPRAGLATQLARSICCMKTVVIMVVVVPPGAPRPEAAHPQEVPVLEVVVPRRAVAQLPEVAVPPEVAAGSPRTEVRRQAAAQAPEVVAPRRAVPVLEVVHRSALPVLEEELREEALVLVAGPRPVVPLL